MNFKHTNINSFWGYLIIEELIRNGVDYFCISPGSRSTPLTIAVADNAKAQSVVCYDERGAAFHALGYAKATGKPAVLICTSGSALANYFPAIVEANQTNTPLIILSADRPPELRATGANQTIDQVKIFGDYVKWFFDLPAPNTDINPGFLLTTVDQAVSQVNSYEKGPVHLNCMFRKPLEPIKSPIPAEYINKMEAWESQTTPYTQIISAELKFSENDIAQIANLINDAQRGIIAIGRLNPDIQISDLIKMVVKLNWPIMADITSGIKTCSELPNLIRYFDQILLKRELNPEINPDLILHLGAPLTSKRFLKFASVQKNIKYVHITDTDKRNDPEHIVTHRFIADMNTICKNLAHQINPKPNDKLDLLKSHDKKITEIVDNIFKNQEKVTEISTAKIISKRLPSEQVLFLGNSMPIRDFDMYADFKNLPVQVGSNRGASGIDGTLASAIGYAVGHNKAVTLVLGDLALIHDLNSLSQLSAVNQQIIVIVINNSGGGIFSFLPVSDYDDVFEPFFGTPHGITFDQAAQMFGLEYANPATDDELLKIYNSFTVNKKSVLIEVTTNRVENSDLHKKIQHTIISNL
jgi:2-succinyl-5-enolpyruvyl-6-hydroxy-3-cyclohexene-1-carboxylate synthase